MKKLVRREELKENDMTHEEIRLVVQDNISNTEIILIEDDIDEKSLDAKWYCAKVGPATGNYVNFPSSLFIFQVVENLGAWRFSMKVPLLLSV